MTKRSERIERLDLSLQVLPGKQTFFTITAASLELAGWAFLVGMIAGLGDLTVGLRWAIKTGFVVALFGLFFQYLIALLAAVPDIKIYRGGGEPETIGGDLRDLGDGHWLRARGFPVPGRECQGVNAWPRWAAAVLESGRMNRDAGLSFLADDGPDGEARAWIKGMQKLWCVAGWAWPRNGWHSPMEPDLSGGISDLYDEGRRMLYVARDERGRESVCAYLRASVEQRIADGLPPTPRARVPRG